MCCSFITHKCSYWMFGLWFLSFFATHFWFLWRTEVFFLWPHHEETMLHTGRGHYLLVQHKWGAADRNSQALCVSVYQQHYFYLACGARKAVHFKAFRAFTRKSREDYRIYCSRRCHLAFFFLLLWLYICFTGYAGDSTPVSITPLLEIDRYYSDITKKMARVCQGSGNWSGPAGL